MMTVGDAKEYAKLFDDYRMAINCRQVIPDLPPCDVCQACLKVKIANLERELVELRALEMNHEGACVRLKARIAELEAAKPEGPGL